MEEAFRPGGLLDKAPVKVPKDPATAVIKREDIDLIVGHFPFLVLVEVLSEWIVDLQVHEFEITRTQAEKVLLESEGDVVKALEACVAH